MNNLSVRKVWSVIKWNLCKYILGKKTILCKVQGNLMHLDLINEGISRVLALQGIREADHTKIMKDELQYGMAVLDIGANIGYYPLLEASHVGVEGKVYAIEPDLRNIELLRDNVRVNNFQNIVDIYNMACSNKNGKEKIFLAKKTNLNTFASKDDHKFLAEHLIDRTEEISVTTVDKFLEEKSAKIDFVRMDIEGYEVEVFQGMHNTLQSAKAGFKVLFELHPQAYSENHSLAKELEKFFQWGFRTKIVISAGEARPKKFVELGYEPEEVIHCDGFDRGWYGNIKNEDTIQLTCYLPKVSRYVLLEKT